MWQYERAVSVVLLATCDDDGEWQKLVAMKVGLNIWGLDVGLNIRVLMLC